MNKWASALGLLALLALANVVANGTSETKYCREQREMCEDQCGRGVDIVRMHFHIEK